MKMTIGEWVLSHQKSTYGTKVQFALFKVVEGGARHVARFQGSQMHFNVIPAGEDILEPSFLLEQDQLQAFMDTLWEMGVRPKARRFEAEIAIKHQHLQDMRKVAFHALGIKED
jgi:hypothetical protein